MRIVRSLSLCAAFCGLAACGSLPPADAPPVVAGVDLPRYMGLWHEIARLPMPYQAQCASEVQALYTLNADQSVRVENSCRDQQGQLSRAEGLAAAADETGAKLRVSFLPAALRWLPAGKAHYWVLRLDPDYRHALVGTPDRRYLWVLSRQAQMDEAVLRSYLQTAASLGYDSAALIRNP